MSQSRVKQSAFTIFTEIDGDDGPSNLSALLQEIGDSVGEDKRLRFPSLRDLHFASLSVIAPDEGSAYLVFEGNVDGSPEDFLRQLLLVSGPAIHDIYRYSKGYPPEESLTPESALHYLLSHDIGANAFFVAWPGWSAETIKREQLLRERIEVLLDDLEPGERAGRTPESLHSWIVQRLEEDPDFAWATTPPSYPFLVRHGVQLTAVAASGAALSLAGIAKAAAGGRSSRRRLARATLLSIVAAAGAVALRLRTDEAADDRRDRSRVPDWLTVYECWSQNLTEIQRREDVQPQNHMISVTEIKKGWFRERAPRRALGGEPLRQVRRQQGRSRRNRVDPLRPLGHHPRPQARRLLEQLRRQLGELPRRLHRQSRHRPHRRVEQHH